jgi:hypothetical protein
MLKVEDAGDVSHDPDARPPNTTTALHAHIPSLLYSTTHSNLSTDIWCATPLMANALRLIVIAERIFLQDVKLV